MAIKIKNFKMVKTRYSIFDFDCYFDFDFEMIVNALLSTLLS